MNRLILGTALLALVTAFGLGPAFGQSSGSVATDELQTVCEISPTAGSLSCVDPATGKGTSCPTFGSATPLLTAQIQTSSGSGNGLIITPSIDVGLFTDTFLSGSGTLTGTDTEITGVMVTVTVDGKPAQPEVNNGSNVTGVVYEQRFQELSASNLQCGGGGACSLKLILSSMSAHSFNFFYPNVVQGTHTIKVYATLTNPPATQTDACVGPATLTTVQVKDF